MSDPYGSFGGNRPPQPPQQPHGQQYPQQYGQPPAYPSAPPYAAGQPTKQGDRRPGVTTAGAVIAIVLSSIAALFYLVGLLGVLVDGDSLGGDEAVFVALFVIVGLGCCTAAIVAAARTLAGSKGWWIALIVLAALAIATAVLGFVAGAVQLAEDDSVQGLSATYEDEPGDEIAVIVGSLLWLSATLASLLLIVSRRSRQWIGRRSDGRGTPWYAPRPY